MRRTTPLTLLAAMLAALAFVSCGPDLLLGPDALQGIEGVVMIGPQCPVQSLEDPCPDLPYRAWIDVRAPSGRQLTRVRSDEDGRFRMGLRPGTYTLRPESGDPFPVAETLHVVVVRDRYTEVTIDFDTGIR
jgi:hypothetical protein